MSKKVLTSWWTGKQAPPPLPPSPVSAKNQRFFGRGDCKETIFFSGKWDFPTQKSPRAHRTRRWARLKVREGCGPLELTRRRRGQIPLRTSLSQIPLKFFGFPGAESARKRFFLRGGQTPTPKKSAPGATNRNLRFRLVGREATCLPFWQATFPTYTPPGTILIREGFGPLELSLGFSTA